MWAYFELINLISNDVITTKLRWSYTFVLNISVHLEAFRLHYERHKNRMKLKLCNLLLRDRFVVTMETARKSSGRCYHFMYTNVSRHMSRENLRPGIWFVEYIQSRENCLPFAVDTVSTVWDHVFYIDCWEIDRILLMLCSSCGRTGNLDKIKRWRTLYNFLVTTPKLNFGVKYNKVIGMAFRLFKYVKQGWIRPQGSRVDDEREICSVFSVWKNESKKVACIGSTFTSLYERCSCLHDHLQNVNVTRYLALNRELLFGQITTPCFEQEVISPACFEHIP